MPYIWLGIIILSAIPLLYAAWLVNPFSLLVYGVDRWRERVERLYPWRWWILFLMVVCGFSVAVYTVSYAS